MAKTSRQRALAGFEDLDQPVPAGTPPSPPEIAAVERSESVVARSAPESLAGCTVYAVDANSLIYQVFHALPEMTGPAGQPVGAIHGFTRDIVDLIEKKRPDYLFCAFDGKGDDNYRLDLYAEYKAQRAEMPDDLRLQMPNIRRMMDALGVPCLECKRFEADDILATMARETAERGGTCFVVTADKDCRQLINERVKLFNIRKNEIYDEESLREQWGVRPDQVVDYQSLVGDPVDNVPGVPLIGPKLAAELLQKYETLDNVLEHASEVNGQKRRENLLRYRDQALLSRSLVKLDAQVPLDIDWNAGRVGQVDRALLEGLCREFGFRRLAERVFAVAAPRDQSATALPEPAVAYHTVTDSEALKRLAESLAREPRVAVHFETTSASPRGADWIGCSFAYGTGERWYVPIAAVTEEGRGTSDPVVEALRPILESETPEKVGQNLKHAMVVLRSHGVALRGCAVDVSVADYLLESGERNHGLDDLAHRYLDYEGESVQRLAGATPGRARRDTAVELMTRQAGEAADVVWQLGKILPDKLAAADLTRLFEQLEMPLTEVLAEMEFNGITVDVDRLAELGHRFGDRLRELEREIYELAGRPFNIDSRVQLSELLFEQLRLPVVKRTKTGPSTDAEVLEELAQSHPLPAKIIEYRQHAKLKSTYVDALPSLVHSKTGRIHTSFKQDVAATGRLSSTDPNLQNIPVRGAEGREIRSAFLPAAADWSLLCADYSQIELRVLAHFSQDEALQRAFADNQDVHAMVASEVFGVGAHEVTREMRRVAKVVNFGVIYGQSAFGLAKTLGIDSSEAARFIDAYFRRYAGVEKFMGKVLEDSRRDGYVSTILGRRRAVQGVRDLFRSGNSRQRNLPERIAINTVIQGSAADLIKQAMIQVHHRLRRERFSARLLLQIHDELVLEAPASELPSLVPLVVAEMTQVGPLNVPLQVDVKIGPNWAACEAVKLQ